MSLNPKSNQYSPELEKELFHNLKEKGWNIYNSPAGTDAEQCIKENLSLGPLDAGARYVLLPAALNPRSPDQVFDALEKLAQKLSRKVPEITIGSDSYPITGFTLREDGVKLHTPNGAVLSDRIFVEALASLVRTY